MQYLHVHFNESLNSYKHDRQLLSQNRQTCSKADHLYITCSKCLLKHERRQVDDGATSPTARSMNSVIQTVHSFLMHRFSSSTSEILERAEGRHFEPVR